MISRPMHTSTSVGVVHDMGVFPSVLMGTDPSYKLAAAARTRLTLKDRVRDENDGPEVVYDPYGDDEVLVKSSALCTPKAKSRCPSDEIGVYIHNRRVRNLRYEFTIFDSLGDGADFFCSPRANRQRYPLRTSRRENDGFENFPDPFRSGPCAADRRSSIRMHFE